MFQLLRTSVLTDLPREIGVCTGQQGFGVFHGLFTYVYLRMCMYTECKYQGLKHGYVYISSIFVCDIIIDYACMISIPRYGYRDIRTRGEAVEKGRVLSSRFRNLYPDQMWFISGFGLQRITT